MESQKIIGTLTGTCSVHFSSQAKNQAINLHWLGTKACNRWDEENGNLVPIEHPNMDKVVQAQAESTGILYLQIEVDLTESGQLINARVKK